MLHTKHHVDRVYPDSIQKKILSLVTVIAGLAQLVYIVLLLFADLMSVAYWNVLYGCFMFTVLWLNEKGFFEHARWLFALTSPLLIGFTVIFGPIGAEFAQMIVIVLSQLIWPARSAIRISLFALLCFVIAKWLLQNLEYQDYFWVGDAFYAINMTFCFLFIFLFIFLFKKQLAEKDELIESANRQLRQANDELTSLYESALDSNPLTGLPGKNLIRRSVERALASESAWLLVYVDIDNFKSFNDRYGFALGDEVIRFVAQLLQTLFLRDGGDGRLVGHIGGDDFFLVLDKDIDYKRLGTVITEFEKGVLDFYDQDARESGFIQSIDRQGEQQQFPIMTISLMGIDTSTSRCETFLEVSDVCADLKKKAKSVDGSCLIFDLREND